MPSQYPKEQLLQIYKVLPEPLKEVLGSAETQDQIDTICRENQVTNDALISNIYNLTMDVFMGLVKLEDFDKNLAQILQGEVAATQEIAHRIQRFILFPLKAEIAQLHKNVDGAGEGSPNIGVATPRHSDRAGAPQKAQVPSDYVVEEPAESSPESSIEAGPPPATTSPDVGGGGEDPYREKAE